MKDKISEVVDVLVVMDEYLSDRLHFRRQPLRVALSGDWHEGTARRFSASRVNPGITHMDTTVRWVYPTDDRCETLMLLLEDIACDLREMRRADREKSKD